MVNLLSYDVFHVLQIVILRDEKKFSYAEYRTIQLLESPGHNLLMRKSITHCFVFQYREIWLKYML